MKTLTLILLLLLCPLNVWGSIVYDGVDDIVDTSLTSNFAQITYSVWVYFDSVTMTDGGRIVDKEGEYILFVTTGGEYTSGFGTDSVSFFVSKATNNGQWYTPSNSIVDDTWHHIFVSYDSSSDANNPIMYIDGVLQTIDERNTPNGAVSTNASDFTIGNRDDGARAFGGKIEEIGLWNTNITTVSQITNLANSKRRRIPLEMTPGNLQLHYAVDDGPDGTSADSDTIADLSGNGNNGTGDNGANNTGLTWQAGEVLSYPPPF